MIEKPQNSESQFAIPGLYFFDSTVYELARNLKPSERGELEIVDLLNFYLRDNLLNVEILERGTAWLDTGTAASLLAASEFVRVIEERQGLKIGCPEEISLRLNLINRQQFNLNLTRMPDGPYKKYLLTI
jgi:glucose-1-phosphate thymidylyltransferase